MKAKLIIFASMLAAVLDNNVVIENPEELNEKEFRGYVAGIVDRDYADEVVFVEVNAEKLKKRKSEQLQDMHKIAVSDLERQLIASVLLSRGVVVEAAADAAEDEEAETESDSPIKKAKIKPLSKGHKYTEEQVKEMLEAAKANIGKACTFVPFGHAMRIPAIIRGVYADKRANAGFYILASEESKHHTSVFTDNVKIEGELTEEMQSWGRPAMEDKPKRVAEELDLKAMEEAAETAKVNVGKVCTFVPFRSKDAMAGIVRGVTKDKRTGKVFYRIECSDGVVHCVVNSESFKIDEEATAARYEAIAAESAAKLAALAPKKATPAVTEATEAVAMAANVDLYASEEPAAVPAKKKGKKA
jgi:hypothetical protein